MRAAVAATPYLIFKGLGYYVPFTTLITAPIVGAAIGVGVSVSRGEPYKINNYVLPLLKVGCISAWTP